MSTLTKREQIDQSIESIFRLLEDVCRAPGAYAENEKVLHALKSQGCLCALDAEFSIRNEQVAIKPISLNTLKKRLAENGPDRDFIYLDKLRAHAQAAITALSEDPPVQKKRSNSALEQQVEELKASVSQLHAVNMVLIQALEVNRRDLITIADTPGTGLRQKRIKDAIDRVIRILRMNPAPFDDITLLSTEKHLKLVPNEKTSR
ncbi:hypothetical protein [Pseudomonas simiae]|uniref:hypothetical protein n=1 Tax=Pseudomonas simiae TaxID=321846 RepID=UPI0027363550|nr:hypothetical protein [Pseudomonas simiae]WLH99819.1 hypothetical protein PSH95_20700 [Pseudomonas simiae]